MKSICSIILILFVAANIIAQEGQKTCVCCTPEYHQFDFWLGDWEVFNAAGVKVGENKILKMQDNCVIQENWTSVGANTGTSYNYYDKNNKVWNQTWIDNSGNVLQLKGEFENNSMVLKSERIKSQSGDRFYTNRIIWSKDSLGNVNQKWDIVDDEGKVLQVIFDGTYKGKSKISNPAKE